MTRFILICCTEQRPTGFSGLVCRDIFACPNYSLCNSKRNIHMHKYRLTKKREIICIQFPLYLYIHAQRHISQFPSGVCMTDLTCRPDSRHVCQNYFWSLRWLVSMHDEFHTFLSKFPPLPVHAQILFHSTGCITSSV